MTGETTGDRDTGTETGGTDLPRGVNRRTTYGVENPEGLYSGIELRKD